MVACQLSGIPSKVQAFQKNLANSSCPTGGLEPESSMVPTYNSGLRFVINNKVISFIHLSEKYYFFLTMLYKKGLSNTAVNTARSALSSLLSLPDGSTIGKHPLVSRLLKGIFQNRPPQPRYSTVWDVNTVLTHFQQMPSIKELCFFICQRCTLQ